MISKRVTAVITTVTILAIAVTFSIAILLFNTRTSLGQQNGAQPTDSIAMTIYLRPHENKYLANDGYYQINTGSMTISKGSKFCPSGTCQYSIEKSGFYPNTFTGGYVFEGVLKASVVSNGTTYSRFYPMRADLDKIAAQERNGQTTEFLKGTIGFSGGGSNCIGCTPEFKYNTNGTLFVHPYTPVLVLRGILNNNNIETSL